MFQASGGAIPLAGLAEVEAAKQFAHKKDVCAVDNFRAEGAVDGEFLECESGTQVGESTQGRADLKQAGLGTLVGRQRIKFVAAHCAEQHGIGVQRGGKSVGGQGRAVLDNGHAADAALSEGKFVTAQCGGFLEDSNCFIRNFGTDAVAGDY